MASNEEQDRIKALLTEAITVLCKNGLGYKSEFCIDGLLGITVDKEDVFLVKINETINRAKKAPAVRQRSHSDGLDRDDNEPSTTTKSHPPKRHHTSSPYHKEISYNETESFSPEKIRKRHPDQSHDLSLHPGRKKRIGDSRTEPIVIKEEVLNEDDLQQFGVLSAENMDKMKQALHERTESFDSTPSTSKWPDVSSFNDSSASFTSNFQQEGDSTMKSDTSDNIRPDEPLDYTLAEEKRLEHQFRLNTSAAEAAQLALLQQQKSLLQAMPPMAGMWQPMNPDYLRMQHKMARPYVCEECGKTFTSSCGRRRHMDTHRGIYPYRCEHCGKGFTASNNLKAHMTLHTNVNNFKCDICGEAFRYSQYLKDHVRKEHLEVGVEGFGGLGTNMS